MGFKEESLWLLRDKYKGRLTPKAKRDLEKLKKGEHVNYLIGWSPFLGCRIDLSLKPLIPRPETEYWTEEILKIIPKSKVDILDAFSGSGCVGVAVLKHKSKAQVDFADIEEKYFRGTKKSLKLNRISPKRSKFIRSDVFSGIKKKYDFILANPPYIPSKGRVVMKSVLKNDPHAALFGGTDGMKYIRKILKTAKRYLKPDGKLLIEFDPIQKRSIALEARSLSWETSFQKDQYGRWRTVLLRNKKAA